MRTLFANAPIDMVNDINRLMEELDEYINITGQPAHQLITDSPEEVDTPGLFIVGHEPKDEEENILFVLAERFHSNDQCHVHRSGTLATLREHVKGLTQTYAPEVFMAAAVEKMDELLCVGHIELLDYI